ncbi:MAG: transcription-repair coupling factor [Candidatus Erginobacter occultus]|nr:transcription-repair coupling factor [Candidatus Erginobacter occultus]
MKEFAAALKESREFSLFLSLWESPRDGTLAPAPGSSPGFVVARAAALSPRPYLAVAPSEREAERLSRELEGYAGLPPLLFPASAGGADPLAEAARRGILARLVAGEGSPALVASPAALAADLPPPKLFQASFLRLAPGVQLDPVRLAKRLVDLGYEYQDPVLERGNFARRGGILDLYPVEGDYPIRVEFDGEAIDSLRRFDPLTQRSLGPLDSTGIHPLSGEGTASLLDYLPEGCRIVSTGRFEAGEAGWGEGRFPRLCFFPDAFEDPAGPGRSALRLSLRTLERFKYRSDSALYPLLTAVGELLEDGYRVLLYAHNPGEADRLREILSEQGISSHHRLKVAIGETGEGFVWEEPALAVIGDSEIFSRYRIPRPRQRYHEASPGLPRADFKPGDYVVHLDHGIGRFLGVKEITSAAGRKREMLVIRYAENARLFCDLTQSHLLSRYLGSGKARPQLDRLGGGRWPRARAAARRAVDDLAAELLDLQARRAAAGGRQFSPDTLWQKEFEAAFIYPETPDQSRALAEIKSDLEAAKPMDRLLCGDVGYGKTEVAVRAAFKAAMEGAQAAVLVPTTVLAQQHTRTFRERMSDYPVRVETLSRLVPARRQKEIVADLKEGKVDIVIGTHRLLQGDIDFRDLGLVIIDEEQRFGVRHKEKLKKIREQVYLLTLTATPIPRTLYLSLTGARDLSAITTPPQDRLAVETRVVPYNPKVIRNAVEREVARGGQVFYLHNRVKDIEQVKRKIETWFPALTIAVGHGRMGETELAEVMDLFAEGEIDILVCTTIIESGLDIPNANTIIVENAHRFGLADLYQLRGRVGRFKHLAYAYFFYPQGAFLEEAARKRLLAIEEFSSLGAGYGLALRDLEIRGAGNILGKEQHGHIAAVGFELYCRLLEESVTRLKAGEGGGGKGPAPKAALEFEIPAALPADYTGTEVQRVELYRRWAALSTAKEIEDWLEELQDRFGPPPEEAEILAELALFKLTAAGKGVTAVRRVEDKYVLMGEDRILKAWPGPEPDSPESLRRFLNEASHKLKTL